MLKWLTHPGTPTQYKFKIFCNLAIIYLKFKLSRPTFSYFLSAVHVPKRGHTNCQEGTRESMDAAELLSSQTSECARPDFYLPRCLLQRTWMDLLRKMLASHSFPYVLRLHNNMDRIKGKKWASLDPGKIIRRWMGEMTCNLHRKETPIKISSSREH